MTIPSDPQSSAEQSDRSPDIKGATVQCGECGATVDEIFDRLTSGETGIKCPHCGAHPTWQVGVSFEVGLGVGVGLEYRGRCQKGKVVVKGRARRED